MNEKKQEQQTQSEKPTNALVNNLMVQNANENTARLNVIFFNYTCSLTLKTHLHTLQWWCKSAAWRCIGGTKDFQLALNAN